MHFLKKIVGKNTSFSEKRQSGLVFMSHFPSETQFDEVFFGNRLFSFGRVAGTSRVAHVHRRLERNSFSGNFNGPLADHGQLRQHKTEWSIVARRHIVP